MPYRRATQWILGIIGAAFILFALVYNDRPSSELDDIDATDPDMVAAETELSIDKPIPVQDIVEEVKELANIGWQSIKLKEGDTLSKLFIDLKLSLSDLHNMITSHPLGKQLSRIKSGQNFDYLLDDNGQIQSIKLALSPLKTLHIERNLTGFDFKLEKKQVEKQLAYAFGTISNSLFISAQRAGLDDKMIMNLASIFGWDVDFALDIRPGDQFKVLYENKYLEGTKISTGDIVAAEFTNRGRVYRAIRYTDLHGQTRYYTPKGYSVQKAFLRTPVKFTRISSKFSLGRRHPVLHRIRAHKGVDYAAPYGTPIKATGDGKITFIGRNGGYGKVIKIQHGQRYTTVYAHMSRYAKGMRNGRLVRQGQVIGYVGSTGLATGAHLHYEFRVNGVHRNPLTVKLPKSIPIHKKHKKIFTAYAKQMLEILNDHHQVAVSKVSKSA